MAIVRFFLRYGRKHISSLAQVYDYRSLLQYFICRTLWIPSYLSTMILLMRLFLRIARWQPDIGRSLQLLVFNIQFIILYIKVLLKPSHFNFLSNLPAENARWKSCLTIILWALNCKIIQIFYFIQISFVPIENWQL